jgi:DNA-binding transcriptional LysR family regulator
MLPAISHRHIEVFRAVMMAGGVSEAARLLHSSQPTISRELARLESLLGYALFERQRGRLKATARALALFDEVLRSYQGLERVVARAGELARGEQEQLSVLCLPALAHALLPAASAAFLRQHAQARLAVTPQESPLLEEWMGAQRYDIGLTEGRQAAAGTTIEPLLSLDELCVLPASHALCAKACLEPQDFDAQAFVSLAADDPYRLQLDSLFAERGIQRSLRIETHSAAAVCEMVRQGLGLAIVNPLTALACAGQGLELRRFSVSVPFSVNVLKPVYRPAQALGEALLACLKNEASAIQARLEALA